MPPIARSPSLNGRFPLPDPTGPMGAFAALTDSALPAALQAGSKHLMLAWSFDIETLLSEDSGQALLCAVRLDPSPLKAEAPIFHFTDEQPSNQKQVCRRCQLRQGAFQSPYSYVASRNPSIRHCGGLSPTQQNARRRHGLQRAPHAITTPALAEAKCKTLRGRVDVFRGSPEEQIKREYDLRS
jgi:hypothetical protein